MINMQKEGFAYHRNGFRTLEREKLSDDSFSLFLLRFIIGVIEAQGYEKETDKRNHKSFV